MILAIAKFEKKFCDFPFMVFDSFFCYCGDILVILGPLWQTFVSSLGVYERASIEGAEDSYDGRYDSDGSEKSLESYVMQVKM